MWRGRVGAGGPQALAEPHWPPATLVQALSRVQVTAESIRMPGREGVGARGAGLPPATEDPRGRSDAFTQSQSSDGIMAGRPCQIPRQGATALGSWLTRPRTGRRRRDGTAKVSPAPSHLDEMRQNCIQ